MKVAMKTLVVTLAIQSVAMADALPNGTFKGQGIGKEGSKSEKYTVTTKINGNEINSDYTLSDGTQRQWHMTMAPKAGSQFDVKAADHVIGNGYCLDYVALCHYEIRVGDFSLEETLTFQEGKLYKFGSKLNDGTRSFWQESLAKND